MHFLQRSIGIAIQFLIIIVIIITIIIIIIINISYSIISIVIVIIIFIIILLSLYRYCPHHYHYYWYCYCHYYHCYYYCYHSTWAIIYALKVEISPPCHCDNCVLRPSKIYSLYKCNSIFPVAIFVFSGLHPCIWDRTRDTQSFER